MLERQVAWRAFARAWAKTGKRIAAKIAIIAITTSNSINVKARVERRISDIGLPSFEYDPSAILPIRTPSIANERPRLLPELPPRVRCKLRAAGAGTAMEPQRTPR